MTAVPPPSSPAPKEAPGWKALACVLVCGYVDAYTLLTLGVYTSFMSGNTASTGMDAEQAKFAAAGHSLLPVPSFLLGAFIGALLQGRKDGAQVARVLVLTATILVAVMAATGYAAPGWLCTVGLSAAMGMLNTAIVHIGRQSINLGFVTGDIRSFAQHLVDALNRVPVSQAESPRDTHWRRMCVLASTWVVFLAGAVLGSVMETHLGAWALALPASVLFALAVRTPPPHPILGPSMAR